MLDYSQEEKEIFMSEALKEAQKSLDKAEIPIGCVIVKDKEIVGRGHNAREELNQAIMHAEVMAIQEANRTVGNWRLLDCTLFVTIEPCVMCSGAIGLARIPKVIYGACNQKFGGAGSLYDILRDEYDIQIEFGDICNILAYISIGDRIQDIERLVGALEDIKRLYSKDKTGLLSGEYINPKVAVSPQEAFYSQKKSVRIMDAVGAVSGEFVMCYPPGIPILAPGELITIEIAQYIVFAKEKGCSMQGTEDPAVEYLKVLEQ